jgi:sugar/nucleoside kinase (ribokinase family)
MRLVAVGSFALDTIRVRGTLHRDLLGGSGSYFALAAAPFGGAGLVGVVGDDFPEADLERLRARGADLRGLERRPGRTFRWEAEYAPDLKERRTLGTEEGVCAGFHPHLPPDYATADALFLANIDPLLQLEVLAQTHGVGLVAVDTMNYWINGKPEALRQVIGRAHLLLVNDEEAALLTGRATQTEAIEALGALGPAVVVMKKGPHGVLARGPWGWLAQPALPLTDVVDPTGAGDSFAGGLLGYLAGRDWRARDAFAAALAVATAVASLAVGGIGVAGLAAERAAELAPRCAALREMTRFDVPRHLGVARAGAEGP